MNALDLHGQVLVHPVDDGEVASGAAVDALAHVGIIPDREEAAVVGGEELVISVAAVKDVDPVAPADLIVARAAGEAWTEVPVGGWPTLGLPGTNQGSGTLIVPRAMSRSSVRAGDERFRQGR